MQERADYFRKAFHNSTVLGLQQGIGRAFGWQGKDQSENSRSVGMKYQDKKSKEHCISK